MYTMCCDDDLRNILDHIALLSALELEHVIGSVQLLPQQRPLSVRLTAVNPPAHHNPRVSCIPTYHLPESPSTA